MVAVTLALAACAGAAGDEDLRPRVRTDAGAVPMPAPPVADPTGAGERIVTSQSPHITRRTTFSSSGTGQIAIMRGDTVSGLAHRHGVSLGDLIAVNGLVPPYRIYVGQHLVLPAGTARRAPRPGAPPIQVAEADPLLVSRPEGVSDASLEVEAPPPPPLPPAQAPAAGASLDTYDTPESTPSRFGWPVEGRILSGFGPKAAGQRNDGINIAAPRGSPVRAADDGIVAYAGNELRGFGNLILLRHGDGWTTAYAHNDAMLVKKDDRVRRGQIIGRLGSSGGLREPQLHFEIRKGATAMDPMKYLGPAPGSTAISRAASPGGQPDPG